MKKKVLIIFFLFLVFALTGFCIYKFVLNKEIEKIYLTDKYYNNGEFIEVKNNDLEDKKDETYILFTYNNYCSFSVPCDEIFKNVMKKNKIDVLSMPFEEFKKTKFYEKIKYGPSIIIINKNKIIKYLDAEKNEDIDRYQDSNKFEEWLGKYIYLNK